MTGCTAMSIPNHVFIFQALIQLLIFEPKLSAHISKNLFFI